MSQPVPKSAYIVQLYDDWNECQCGEQFMLRAKALAHQRKTKHHWVKREKLVLDPKWQTKHDHVAYSMPQRPAWWEVEIDEPDRPTDSEDKPGPCAGP